ncbi:MAG: type II secretion system F family protein [Gordonia sp. (in: high G+C Gram-positive bacteria)]|uniref:type II secretion system F family protein n=1 Tax=Gordonia sp. (in: high G+C Gram-positive bacteria) TaxID=84139 RepID=UPI003BB7A12A
MTAGCVVLVALAVLCWPSATAARRVLVLGGAPARRRVRPGVIVMVLAIVPVVGAVVGMGAGIAMGIVAAVVISRHRAASARASRDSREADLARALGVVVAEMSVGAPLVAACRVAAAELDDADSVVAVELGRIAAHVELGGGVDPAVISEELPGLRRLADAWTVSAAHGLPMVDLLEALRRDLVQRKEFAARTKAALAGPRATATVLACLPLLGLGLGQLIGARPVAVLLGTPIGSMLLVFGVTLAAAGVRWADAIVARAAR